MADLRVDDTGKQDYREQIKEGKRDELTGNPVAEGVKRVDLQEPPDRERAKAENYARIWGKLRDGGGEGGPPDLVPLLELEDSSLNRNMVSGGYTVIGPLEGRVEFGEDEHFDAIEFYVNNAQRSSHNAETLRRQQAAQRVL